MLRLVADNSRPARPKPGYREALAEGRCQKCRSDAEVRTVGMREPGQTTAFRRLALCGSCVNAAQSEGYYPVVAAVREIPVSPVSPAMPEPGKLPAARVPVTVARFAGKCPACADPVAVGEMITRGAGDGKWRHARCAVMP